MKRYIQISGAILSVLQKFFVIPSYELNIQSVSLKKNCYTFENHNCSQP